MNIFDIDMYQGRWDTMFCASDDEVDVFSKYLDKHGRKWNSGDRYINLSYDCPSCGCYMFFNQGTRGSAYDARSNVLMFSDFEWDDPRFKGEPQLSTPQLDFDALF